MVDDIGKDYYWEEAFFPWVTWWRLVEIVTIREAACILTGTEPTKYRYGNEILPGDVEAMETALEQAILLGRLRPFAIWAYHAFGEEVPLDEVDPHLRLAPRQTKIRVEDLVEWADARGVPHCWKMNGLPPANAIDLSGLPAELRAAMEAFNAVRADSRATAGKHPKQALSEWLAENKPELSANARDRIASVANWQPGGGAPKTPG